ncbi:hypothetical protein TNCV_3188721 [Trichonephila clavipes]|nr:hypothetical protein TNCV_3188721 [Trichonephila clavipes]
MVSQACLCTVNTLTWSARFTDLSPIEHLGQRVGIPRVLTNQKQVYGKYGTKCLKTSYRTCMLQYPIVSHCALALEGVQQDIKPSFLLPFSLK